ncbi:acetyl-CoA C-acetyltransferase [Aquamicrobium sp. LC103]|uniref:acetyl-CoA C-acetyltransferase n=1 Tax=Aquamicrobium sp. LC103 TaxID=1120658 RepID=UPI00063EAED7|nr:acetyl-CoA C-acetyltransferase [Aquamicrobium sp. LC103]TKT75778.1 acetyl-CoA C-acetyltransferase [Aquamicrobium sp. LC103]
MPEAYIIDAVRTPVGRKKGALSQVHPADLGAYPIKELIKRTGIDPASVDDVIFGCTETLGPQAGDIARTCWLVAGFPDQVPGVTVDRQCGSSQQAIHFAAQAVMSGTQDLVVAGGVQNLNLIPMGAAMSVGTQFGFSDPFASSSGWSARYGSEEVSQFRAAEMIAQRWDCSREDMEVFALESHRRAIDAIDRNLYQSEIVPVGDFLVDEAPRRDTSLEKMAALKPLRPGGRIHAGVASQNTDAAASILIASEQAVKDHGLRPRARIHHMSVLGADPVWMLTAPIPATRRALARTGLRIDDIDLFECNEAFASIPMAWMRELGVTHDKVNVNGGAIALGHPLGATGARIMTSMLNELERRNGKFALQTMCEGGGQSNVTIIERLN